MVKMSCRNSNQASEWKRKLNEDLWHGCWCEMCWNCWYTGILTHNTVRSQSNLACGGRGEKCAPTASCSHASMDKILCHQELKLFWKDGYNGVQPSNNNMYVGVFVLPFFNNHPPIQRPPFVQFRVAKCSSHELDVPFISISLFIYLEREKSK